MGNGGKTESGKRTRVQAEGVLNPVTLLGGQRAAPSAPRITIATQMQSVQRMKISGD